MYKHDIFISYRRLGDTRTWINEYFMPLLKNHLSQELGRVPEVFVDTQIETGNNWPLSLGKAIGRSKILILFWSRTYLESKWCSCEVGHMLERESTLGFRTASNQNGLIFPIIINDGEKMPIQISVIQCEEMREYFKLTLNKDGQKHTEFEDKVKKMVEKIASVLSSAPDWQQDWEKKASNGFVAMLHESKESSQDSPPKFFT